LFLWFVYGISYFCYKCIFRYPSYNIINKSRYLSLSADILLIFWALNRFVYPTKTKLMFWYNFLDKWFHHLFRYFLLSPISKLFKYLGNFELWKGWSFLVKNESDFAFIINQSISVKEKINSIQNLDSLVCLSFY